MVQYTAHEKWGVFQYERVVHVDKRLSAMPYAQAGVTFGKLGEVNLISYSTVVCSIDCEGWLTCTGTYSATTRRHISAFMREYTNGFTYFDAKRCYNNGETLNVYTGEIKKL